MTSRLAIIALLLLLANLGCSPGQDTEAGVTKGGAAKLKEEQARYAEDVAKARPGAEDPILIATGATQFKRKCAFCHGVDGQKKIPLATESAHRLAKFAPDDIAVQVHSGVNIHGKVRNHKLFPTLNGAELYATLLFEKNFFLQGKGDQQWVAWKARLETGKTTFAANCAVCHATPGPKGVTASIPDPLAAPPIATPAGATPAGATPPPAETPAGETSATPPGDLPAQPSTDPAAEPAADGSAKQVAGPTFDTEYCFTHSPQGNVDALLNSPAH
ncbi:MAG: c-type cytochrome, partial [bacterium]